MPLCKSPQLNEVLSIINSHITTEKIFLLGACSTRSQYETIFSPPAEPVCRVNNYHLLILLPSNERRDSVELQDIVENNCRKATPVTSIVIPISVFNQWLEKGHLMAYNVYMANCLVYDSGATPLRSPGNYKVVDLEQKVLTEYHEWTAKGKVFLKTAEWLYQLGEYGIGTFHIHQAAELTWMAIIRLVTGFRAGTHNLIKLSNYAAAFCGPQAHVLPANNDKERRLLKLIQKAYIHGRYKNDFVISENELQLLIERIKQLLAVCDQLEQEVVASREAATV
jgi:uncharacterized protein